MVWSALNILYSADLAVGYVRFLLHYNNVQFPVGQLGQVKQGGSWDGGVDGDGEFGTLYA